MKSVVWNTCLDDYISNNQQKINDNSKENKSTKNFNDDNNDDVIDHEDDDDMLDLDALIKDEEEEEEILNVSGASEKFIKAFQQLQLSAGLIPHHYFLVYTCFKYNS